MNTLELFSGTRSVGKICDELGWSTISLDLKDADININILEWNYKEFPPHHFDIIWASPPCAFFSSLRITNLGKPSKKHGGTIFTKEIIEADLHNEGLPILYKTLEIIDYFKPKYYFIENPQTGKMKNYINRPFYDVDYCMYSNWGYRKRTRIWTNLKEFTPKLCNKKCGNIEGKSHIVKLGASNRTSLKDRYRIPPKLIEELFITILSS